ncbi:glycyl-radical enzyme activating protein [Anaerovorax odorimutans]|uniref:Glycyl-radical enzyme activating protein n=1 Tax=Anaerovorax odorimutans TaxID=109327 RepID=A0ABT1RJL0_9FIRM|nr:glycyl-radical enzyme activating protein [Anaerovorax odorimutans]MCQ4635377.1 glycyl-radical enzyme activating protein [Anaerovorax odorimutans]
MIGTIFDIQKYSLHDGPGIRTLVFMKGCPLRCIWCSNPESQSGECQVGYTLKNCIKCGRCAEICPEQAIDKEDFHIDWEKCVSCGSCAACCPVQAKKKIGYGISEEDLLDKIREDRLFYRNSGGGATIGGGEPAVQSQFVNRVLKRCRKDSIHTCIETCAYAEEDKFQETIEYADLVLFDLKHMDSRIHKKLTGAGNELILKNAHNIKQDVVFRVPLIPGLNDSRENLEETFSFAAGLENAKGVELLPYHNLGESKYPWIGKDYQLKTLEKYSEEQKEELRQWIAGENFPIGIKLL